MSQSSCEQSPDRCRICASPVSFFVSKNGYDVMRCNECGFGQVDVKPQVLSAFYDKDYFSGNRASFAQMEDEPISLARRVWLENELRMINATLPLQVMEIGPGVAGPIAGYFKRFRRSDRYAAIELSEHATSQLRKKGIDVWTGRVMDTAIMDACASRYDFVFATEVIEHDLEPRAFLQAVYAMLKPGGRAAFTTGNLDGRMAQMKKESWYYMDPPAHVSFYTPRAARQIMTEVGFCNLDVTRFGFRHIEFSSKLPTFSRKPFLKLIHASNTSTGMTISGHKPHQDAAAGKYSLYP